MNIVVSRQHLHVNIDPQLVMAPEFERRAVPGMALMVNLWVRHSKDMVQGPTPSY